MEWMWRNKLLLLLLSPVFAFSQDSVIVSEAKTTKTELRNFDEKRWEKLNKNLDYTENIKKKKKRNYDYFNFPDLNINPTLLKIGLVTLVICALVFLLYKILGDTKFLKNTKVKTGDFSLLDEAEENLETADLEKFLREALAQKQFKSAVRIYYLMILKELFQRGFIKWKKGKTNYEYLSEMSDRKEFAYFQSLTKAFEIVWYGDVEITESDYAAISPSFNNMITRLRENGQK